MRRMFSIALAALGVVTLQSGIVARTADAAIVCKDGFQNSGGNWISTPYCNDAHLAQIARQHGVKVSDAEVRKSPGKKDEICRFLGDSGPARDYCPDQGGGRRR